MSEVPEEKLHGSHGSDWFSLLPSERRRERAGIALEFFYYKHEIPEEIRNLPIDTFLRFQLTKSTLGEDYRYAIYAIACVIALYLPYFVLRSLQYDPNKLKVSEEDWDHERKNLLEKIITDGFDLNHGGIAKDISEFCMLGPASLTIPEVLSATSYAAFAIWQDDTFKSLIRLIPSSQKEGKDKNDETPFSDLEQESNYPQEYRLSLGRLRRAEVDAERSYSRLTFRTALYLRGGEGFILSVMGGIGLLVLIINTLTEGKFSPVSYAYGQTTTGSPKGQFVPPLGLPISTWVLMVVGFYLFLLAVLVVFLWKGYLATPKSEKAANFIDRFGTLALGVFLGKVTGL